MSKFAANLTFASAQLKSAGIRLLIEPINVFDIPGFFLTRTDQAVAILDDVGSDNLFIQYDMTTPAATNRARVRSTTPGCSGTSTRLAIADGSGANTNRPPPLRPTSAGASNSFSKPSQLLPEK